ncbi:NifB/NifX family molybdenum-iron cluster-binding protein [Gaoshiqia sediminis]|uniref:NifB/NifX family molybdenum-iron cluster-binding protein n=1 Tax=Gaoshiqia sediminis TaxID=2986998 RepID=A0AA41YCX7_9BACT|nr:NifB/NifX family molybdenum-iron cluster-binding protein [Gaoshiqia sediminis]MCW0484328.1 NifB/NifX family molybdenum-iron cluster-binding protein [Gaoshiqia sediminis]
MKIAITASENKPEAKLDSRFGRCAYFAIYDTENGSTEFIQNPNKESVEGAGPASVQLIASKGVKQIISGEFGGKVKSILESLQIQMIMFNGPEKSVDEIIKLINQN